MARPSKLQPELVASLCKYLAKGLPRESACAKVGINYVTFWRWFNAPDDAFRNDALKAEADWEQSMLERIELAGLTKVDGSWQALAWRLERRWPMKYATGAKRIEAEVTAQIMSKLTNLPIETRAAVADAFETNLDDNGPMAGSTSSDESSQTEQ